MQWHFHCLAGDNGYFAYFSKNIGFDISCKMSPQEQSHVLRNTRNCCLLSVLPG